ncbi:hypothetical protein [Streptomyces xiamenensis]|uniref:hypothetical protein n=1 Tax=Streptomyces xiamenensis TaxID=408015 RepID=UPI0035DEDDA9
MTTRDSRYTGLRESIRALTDADRRLDMLERQLWSSLTDALPDTPPGGNLHLSGADRGVITALAREFDISTAGFRQRTTGPKGVRAQRELAGKRLRNADRETALRRARELALGGTGEEGVDPEVVYSPLAADDPALATIRQLFDAYLAGSGELSAVVAPGAAVEPIEPAPYASVRITSAQVRPESRRAGESLPGGSGSRFDVLVRADGRTPGGSVRPVHFMVTLAGRDGRWEVAGLEDQAPPLRQAQEQVQRALWRVYEEIERLVPVPPKQRVRRGHQRGEAETLADISAITGYSPFSVRDMRLKVAERREARALVTEALAQGTMTREEAEEALRPFEVQLKSSSAKRSRPRRRAQAGKA